MTNPKEEYKNRAILSVEEIDRMLAAADVLPTKYFQLRAKCLVALVKKFGKRRSEIARLQRTDLQIVNGSLEVTFGLSKKHKKGLFQFMDYCKLHNPDVLELSLPEIKAKWREWQQTNEGHKVKNSTSLQSISLDDKYAPFILRYLEYLDQKHSETKFVFPSGRTVFGAAYMIYPDKQLSGRQLLRIIKTLNPSAWLHLFRETKGAEVAKAHGRTLTSVYEVKDSLDLEQEETAYRYVRRYAAKKHEREI